MRRNSSTIPFGYKLADDDKTLVPVAKEIESLNKCRTNALKQIQTADLEVKKLQSKLIL